MTDYAAEAARLQAEHESLRAECALLRAEAARISAINRTILAQLAIAEAERDRLRRFAESVARSRPWRAVQALRAIVGRRW